LLVCRLIGKHSSAARPKCRSGMMAPGAVALARGNDIPACCFRCGGTATWNVVGGGRLSLRISLLWLMPRPSSSTRMFFAHGRRHCAGLLDFKRPKLWLTSLLLQSRRSTSRPRWSEREATQLWFDPARRGRRRRVRRALSRDCRHADAPACHGCKAATRFWPSVRSNPANDGSVLSRCSYTAVSQA
jgi:hypothetical protein